MKKLIVCLLVGLVGGYVWGYTEGHNRMDNVAVRALNKFGVASIKAAEKTRQARVEEAAKP
jgi:hypothetical protein